MKITGIIYDITERKRAEEELRESEEKYRLITENTSDFIATTTFALNPTYTYVSLSHKTLGYNPVDLLGKPCLDFIHPDDKTKLLPLLRRYVSKRAKKHLNSKDPDLFEKIECRFKDKSGNWRHIESTANLIKDKLLLFVSKDITERKRTEEHIHSLTQQLIKAQENERQRISRDLNDHLAQDLSTLKISLDTIFDDKPDTPPEIKKRITKLSQMIHKNIIDVRELAYGLRPADLDQLGLVRTVEQYCEDFSERNGLEIDFISAGMDDLRLNSDTEINLYCLIQEALNNTKKHADASHVTIRLVASFPEIILRIEDDGKGFDVKERLIKARTEKRMGLQSMEERVSLLNGTMSIQSRPAEGTKISIKIHYKEKKSGSKKRAY